MAWQHQAEAESGGNTQVHLVDFPDECPKCHSKGALTPKTLYHTAQAQGEKKLQVVFRCPNHKCHEVFIGYYENQRVDQPALFHFVRAEPLKHLPREFSATIKGISESFTKIYNQALEAENMGLDLICGPGYRKSLEFLVKDYLISKTQDESVKQAILNEALMNCIANRISDANIKGVAKRATWLGNDETHYMRKWETKDLQDLKKLIDLTVHWMEAEALTSDLLKDMPEEGGATK